MPRGNDSESAASLRPSSVVLDTIRDDLPRNGAYGDAEPVATSERETSATISRSSVSATRSSSPLFGTTVIGVPAPPQEPAHTAALVTNEPAARLDDLADLPDLPDLASVHDLDDISATREIPSTNDEEPTPLLSPDGRLTDPTRALSVSRARLAPRVTLRAQPEMPTSFAVPYDGEAMTVRVRSVSGDDYDELPAPIRPRLPSVHPSPIKFVTHDEPAPRARPRSEFRAAAVWVTLAFLVGGAVAVAVHAWGPALRGVVAPLRPHTAPRPAESSVPLLSNVPPEWPSGASRVWSGTMSGESTLVRYILVLRGSDSGRVAGYFSWTVVRLPGARAGEQVRENVEGTYESTLGVLDLRGTLSTNPVVLPVNVYRLRVRPDWVLSGNTLDASWRLAGAPAEAATR